LNTNHSGFVTIGDNALILNYLPKDNSAQTHSMEACQDYRAL